MVGINLNLPFSRTACRSNVTGLSNKPSVNEEYRQAFRSKSYIEMLNKVQLQLSTTSCDKFSSSSSTPNFHAHLSDYILEPTQETLTDMTESLKLHKLLVDYFRTSLEACEICETLLKGIHQTRLNYRKIRRVIKMSKRVFDDFAGYTDEQRDLIFRELAGFSLLNNPLVMIRPAQFQVVHDTNTVLLRKLTSKRKRVTKRAKIKRLCKKIGGTGLVIAHIAIVIALLVWAFHSMIGVITAPGAVGCCCHGLLMKKPRYDRGIQISLPEQLGEQLDIAAKGTFILINDFDTISRQVRRLYDEIEHCKEIARMCVKNRKSEMLKEVVKELQAHEASFLEQLEDLEEHIFLCFHTIDRSRRLVLQEIVDNNDTCACNHSSQHD